MKSDLNDLAKELQDILDSIHLYNDGDGPDVELEKYLNTRKDYLCDKIESIIFPDNVVLLKEK